MSNPRVTIRIDGTDYVVDAAANENDGQIEVEVNGEIVAGLSLSRYDDGEPLRLDIGHWPDGEGWVLLATKTIPDPRGTQ